MIGDVIGLNFEIKIIQTFSKHFYLQIQMYNVYATWGVYKH